MYYKFSDDNKLKKFIFDNYFLTSNGKVANDLSPLVINENEKDYEALKDKSDVKLKSNIIDGTFKVSIEKTSDGLFIHPKSIYCIIKENQEYSFY